METTTFRVDPKIFIEKPDVWEFVKIGLEVIQSRIGNRSKWKPLHVRQAVVNGNSELWLIVDEDAMPQGFYVLSAITDPFIQVPTTLFVWVAYSRPGTNLVDKHFNDVVQRGRELGVEAIEMMSPRKGWERRLAKHGFYVAEQIHRLELN